MPGGIADYREKMARLARRKEFSKDPRGLPTIRSKNGRQARAALTRKMLRERCDPLPSVGMYGTGEDFPNFTAELASLIGRYTRD